MNPTEHQRALSQSQANRKTCNTAPTSNFPPLNHARLQPARRDVIRDLRASTIDGCCYSGMVGWGETYFAALYLAAGFSPTSAAWLATLPVFAGSLFQLVTPVAVARLGSWKRWTVLNASLQSISLILLATMIATGLGSFAVIFLIASLYYGSGQATAPSWNMWIERLVPRSIRQRFLTGRQRVALASLLVAVVTAGSICRICELNGIAPVYPLLVFLAGAGVFRAISAWHLAMQTELPRWHVPVADPAPGIDPLPELSRNRSRPWKRLLLFMALMQMAVYISHGFFTPFKLQMLELNYGQFSALVTMAYLGKITCTGLAGKLVARWGTFRLLLFGAVGIVPMAAAWTLSQNFWYLLAVQWCSGLMWACYELAMVMVFAELIPRGKRLRLMAQYNVANSLAMVLGTCLGAALFAGAGQGFLAYLTIFTASSVCRLLVVGLFPREVFREGDLIHRLPDQNPRAVDPPPKPASPVAA